jgi:hypothetical protein
MLLKLLGRPKLVVVLRKPVELLRAGVITVHPIYRKGMIMERTNDSKNPTMHAISMITQEMYMR